MKVSVIICVYNGNDFLKGIEGYLGRQSFDDYEVIFVVDSRSTDGSLEEIERYCESNDKARFIIQNELTKLGGAKNLGLNAARGDYLWFLDIDDVPSDDFLKIMVDSVENTGSDMAVCNFQFTDDRGWKAPEGNDVKVMSGKAPYCRNNRRQFASFIY